MKFKCIEYKADGNTPKVTSRDLMPVSGCNTLYYRLDGKYLAEIYKTAKGYAVGVGKVHADRLTAPELRRKFAEVDRVSVSELVTSGQLFAGRAVLEFLRLSATPEEFAGAVEHRQAFDRAREDDERERAMNEERRRAEEEANERKRVEALQLEATEVFTRESGSISSEALELLALHCGISIHPRTLGVLRNSVKYVYVDGDRYKLQATKGAKRGTSFSGVFGLMLDIHNCIADARKFLNGEAVA